MQEYSRQKEKMYKIRIDKIDSFIKWPYEVYHKATLQEKGSDIFMMDIPETYNNYRLWMSQRMLNQVIFASL